MQIDKILDCHNGSYEQALASACNPMQKILKLKSKTRYPLLNIHYRIEQ